MKTDFAEQSKFLFSMFDEIWNDKSKVEDITDTIVEMIGNKIVNSLNLTDNMRVALECRIKGLSYPEIGRVLSRAQSSVYEYFIKMRQRYMAIYG